MARLLQMNTAYQRWKGLFSHDVLNTLIIAIHKIHLSLFIETVNEDSGLRLVVTSTIYMFRVVLHRHFQIFMQTLFSLYFTEYVLRILSFFLKCRALFWKCIWHLCVRPSICSTYVHLHFRFQMITLIVNGFSPSLVRALILGRSGLGLLVGKFGQFLYRFICPLHNSGGVLSFHVIIFLCYRVLVVKMILCISLCTPHVFFFFFFFLEVFCSWN